MGIGICLLISDDIDDHLVISEALSSINESVVVVNIVDSHKAVMLLREHEYQPHYLILDLSLHGIKVNSILKIVREGQHSIKTPILIYGPLESYLQIENNDDLLFLEKDYEYSDLKAILEKLLQEP